MSPIRPSGSCTGYASRPALGVTDYTAGSVLCAAVGNGTQADLYVYTHEIFHAATGSNDEVLMDCLSQIWLGGQLPPVAPYGCPDPTQHLALYNSVLDGTFDRPARGSVCEPGQSVVTYPGGVSRSCAEIIAEQAHS